MKILLLWDYYDRYLQYFYGQHAEAINLPYHYQQKQLIDDHFLWYAYLMPYLREMGHEVDIIIGNAQQLQAAWGRENGLTPNVYIQPTTVAIEQIRRFCPDILWIAGSNRYLGAFLKNIRAYCGCIVAWRAVDWTPDTDWAGVDCVFSSYTNLVERFRQIGKRCELVLPCFEESILQQLPSHKRNIPLSFVGSMNMIQFTRRLEMLKHLKQHVPLEIYAERPVFQRRPLPMRSFLSQMRFITFFLRAQRKPAVYGLNMFNVMHRSQITLNVHERSSANFAGNIRMFEATGAGALLLTEASANLSSLFEPDKEVITYHSSEEAVAKIRYYLHNLSEANDIARAGQKRTLRCHNARIRAHQVIQIFDDLLQSL